MKKAQNVGKLIESTMRKAQLLAEYQLSLQSEKSEYIVEQMTNAKTHGYSSYVMVDRCGKVVASGRMNTIKSFIHLRQIDPSTILFNT